MDPKKFEEIMAQRRGASVGKRIVDNMEPVDSIGPINEFSRGIGRGAIKSAAALGPGVIDFAYNTAGRAGEALSKKVVRAMGVDVPDYVKSEPSSFSLLGVSRKILEKADKVVESPTLKGSKSLEKGWREGVKDINWWAGNLGEMAPATLSIMGIAKKIIEKEGKKHLAILASNSASKSAKKKAKIEIGKISAKAAIGPSVALEGSMQHDEYRKWEKKNPEDATAMGDIIATMFGAASGVLEGAGIGGMMMGPFIKKFGKEAGTKAASGFWKEFVKAAPKNILIEGGTEGAQQYIQNIGKKIGYAPDTELTEGIMESLILGGAMGGAFSTFEAGQAKAPRNQTEKDMMTILKSRKRLSIVKGDIAKQQEILDNTDPESKEYEKAKNKLEKGIIELGKQEDIVGKVSKRLKTGTIEEEGVSIAPTDEEAFGTTIDPTLTINEIAEGIDSGEITPDDWDKAPKEKYTEEEVEVVEQHVSDIRNQQDIDTLASGKEVSPIVEQEVMDGTGKESIWSTLPENFTDQEAVDSFQQDLVTFGGDKAAAVSLSKKPISEPVQQLADLFGVRIVNTSIKAKPGGINPNGMIHPNNPNLIYMKDTASRPEIWLLGHEFSHSLGKNNPEAYDTLMKTAIPMFKPSEFVAYQKALSKKMGSKVDKKTVAKEMLGDFVGDKFVDKNFWSKVHKENPSRFKEIINSLREFISKITANFTGVSPESNKFFNDILSLENTLVDVLNEHVGYTGAVEKVVQSKTPTGDIVDLNRGNKHLTHIPIGENGQILMREDKDTIYIERFARAGARTTQGMTNTLTGEGKGGPTAVLSDIKDYAKEKGKKIVANVENNQYLSKQGFKQTDSTMTWEAIKEGTGAAPVAGGTVSEATGTAQDKKSKDKAARIAREMEDKELREARQELRGLDKKIQDELDVAKTGTKEEIIFAKEQHNKFVNRKKELEAKVTDIVTKREKDDQKTGKQVSGDGQPGKKKVGDAPKPTKSKKADRGDRDKQGKKKKEVKPKTLKEKVTEVKQEADYKEIGGVTAEFKRITDSLNKSGQHGDPIAFADAVIEAGIKINVNEEELAYQHAFKVHMMGEENVPTAKKAKKRKTKYTKEEQIKLNVLTAMLNESNRYTGIDQTLTEKEVKEEIDRRVRDHKEETSFNAEISNEPKSLTDELQFSLENKIKFAKKRANIVAKEASQNSSKYTIEQYKKLANNIIYEIVSNPKYSYIDYDAKMRNNIDNYAPGTDEFIKKLSNKFGFSEVLRVPLRSNLKKVKEAYKHVYGNSATLRRIVRGAPNYKRTATGVDELQFSLAPKVGLIKEYTESPSDIVKKIKNIWKPTTNLNNARWLTYDGTFLSDPKNTTNAISHSNISKYIKLKNGNKIPVNDLQNGWKHFVDATGSIRIHTLKNGIIHAVSLDRQPTKRQWAMLVKNTDISEPLSVEISLLPDDISYQHNVDIPLNKLRPLIEEVLIESNKYLKDEGFSRNFNPNELQFNLDKRVDANEAFVAPIKQKIKDLKLDTKLPKKLSTNQWNDTFTKLTRKGKLNPEEYEFSYLPEWLAEQEGDVSREDVLNYLTENAPKVVTHRKNDIVSTANAEVRDLFFEGFSNDDKPLKRAVYVSVMILKRKFKDENLDIIKGKSKEIADSLVDRFAKGRGTEKQTAEQKLNAFRGDELGGMVYDEIVHRYKTEEEHNIEEQQQIRAIRAEVYQEAKDENLSDQDATDLAQEAVERWYNDEHGGYYEPPDYSYDNMVLPGGLGNYNETLIYYNSPKGEYKGTGQLHWGKDNILVHTRYDDHAVSGSNEKALMLYENQSDWQADISKKGELKSLTAEQALNELIPKIKKDIIAYDKLKTVTPLISYFTSKNKGTIVKTVLEDMVNRRSVTMFKERSYNTYNDYIPSDDVRKAIIDAYTENKSSHEAKKYSNLTNKEIINTARDVMQMAKQVSITLKHFNNRFNRAVENFRNENRFADYREDAKDLPFNMTLGYPNAPYKKTWPLLAFKNGMIEAYNRGDDYVAWPSTGDQIAEIEGWGNYQFKGIIDNITKTMPRQVDEFVKRYGGKVEKIDIEGGGKVNAVKITPQLKKLIEDRQVPQFSLDEPIDPKDPNPEVQQQIEKHMQSEKKSLGEKIKDRISALWKSSTSMIPQIRPGELGYFKDRIRLAKEVDKFGSQQAFFRIYAAIGKLSNDERQVFTMNLVLNDMLNDTIPNEDGVAILKDGHLPFKYKTVDQVRASLRHFREQAKKSPRVMNALARRRKSMLKIQGELIDAGFLKEELRGNDSYFHHETLQHMVEGDGYLFGMHRGAGGKSLKMTKDRGSDISAYSLDYITSEFAVLSDAIATLELNKIKKQIKAVYDITPKLEKKANGGKLIPLKGYKILHPAQLPGWGATPKFPDVIAANILEKAKIDPKVKEEMQIASGVDEKWIVPEKIADAMSTVREISHKEIYSKISESFTQAWKKWTLINPFRIIRYNINNMSGDVDIALAYDWRIMQYLPQAMKDIAGDINTMGMKLPFNMQRFGSHMTSEMKAEMKEAHRLGVIGAGFVMHEVTDISSEFEAIMRGPQGNFASKFGQKWWQGSKDITNYRENLLRLASYRYFKDRIKSGEKNIYAASNPTEIDEIRNVNEKAAKLSRELIGDYGRLSEGGEWMRKHMIPFYSWMEINAPRYVRMMRNLSHEGKSRGRAVASSLTWKTSVLGAKFMLFTAMVTAWNNLLFGDDEDELKGYQKRQMHLLFGRRQDGSIRYIPVSGAFRDALSWFGGDDIYYDIKDITSGKSTIGEKAKEMGLAPAWKFYHSSRPIFRSAGEAISGFTMFPTNSPRPIRDKMDYVSKTFSMELAYRFAAGKPTRGLAKEFQSKLTKNVDPGELAYHEIRNKVRAYNKKVGRKEFKSQPTNISNALYYYKKSIQYGDLAAAEKYWEKYLEMGGSLKGLQSSIRLTRPTGGLLKKHRSGFYKTLSDNDKILLNKASKWYRQIYSNLYNKH